MKKTKISARQLNEQAASNDKNFPLGIRSYATAAEAFAAVSGGYGRIFNQEFIEHGIYVLDGYSFQCVMLERFLYTLAERSEAVTDEDKERLEKEIAYMIPCEENGQMYSQKLFDTNFIMYSNIDHRFYTCLMDMEDLSRECCDWSEEQWDEASWLIDAYGLDIIWNFAKDVYEKLGMEGFDDAWNFITENNMYIDAPYRGYDDLVTEINDWRKSNGRKQA